MSREAITDAAWNLLYATGNYLSSMKGFEPVVIYVRRSYQNDPHRVLLELLVFGWALYHVVSRRKVNGRDEDEIRLTGKEIDSLIKEWTPEPLVGESVDQFTYDCGFSDHKGLRLFEKQKSLREQPQIKGQANLKNILLSTGEKLQWWASTNFLGLQNTEEAKKIAIQTLRQYGVGACGPTGFYGTQDKHMQLEKDIAQVLNVDEAIIYSQSFMAVASVIPAFSKKGDILVADDGVACAILTGLEISRSHVYFFRHNDMVDLERVLDEVDAEFLKLPLTRRFIVTEGLFANSGDLCQLPQLLEIKERRKYRLILDETLSFACLGPRGLGVTDHFGIPASRVEIIIGSLSTGLGSSGGFCAGSHYIVDHQRLSSQANCFSAALPALLASSASCAIRDLLQDSGKMTKNLKYNIEAFQETIENYRKKVEYSNAFERFQILGDLWESPIRIIRLRNRHENILYESLTMNDLVAELRARGFLISRAHHLLSREHKAPPPSIKICISAGFTQEETVNFARVLMAVLSQAPTQPSRLS